MNKTMAPLEFYHEGYIHEINRLILHPLGLALALETDPDRELAWFVVLDHRDDPEGMCFESPNPDKTRNIYRLQIERAKTRVQKLGYWHQSVLEQDEAERLVKNLYEEMGIKLSINVDPLHEEERKELERYRKAESRSIWTCIAEWCWSWFSSK